MDVTGALRMIDRFIENTTVYTVVVNLLALTQGALLGLEREKAKIETTHEEGLKGDFPGLRTFGLIALAGSLSSMIAKGYFTLNPLAEMALFSGSLLFTVMLVLMFMYFRMFREGFIGITTYFVMMITFLLGVLTGAGYIIESLSVTFLTAGLLALKRFVNRLMEQLSYDEFVAGLELGIIMFILGPIALYSDYQFYGISLKGAYIFFVLILAISYNSYLIYKVKGIESIKIISFLGGLVNSEATLVNIARIIKDAALLGLHTVYINLGMIVRSLILTVLGSIPFLQGGEYSGFLKILIPGYVLALVITFLAFPLLSKRAHINNVREVSLKSPLEFSSAIRGALIYVILFVINKTLGSILGQESLLPISFIGGMASAGATIFSLLSLSGQVTHDIIAVGSLLAVAGGLMNKPLYGHFVAGGKGFTAVLLPSLPPALGIVLFIILYYTMI